MPDLANIIWANNPAGTLHRLVHDYAKNNAVSLQKTMQYHYDNKVLVFLKTRC